MGEWDEALERGDGNLRLERGDDELDDRLADGRRSGDGFGADRLETGAVLGGEKVEDRFR